MGTLVALILTHVTYRGGQRTLDDDALGKTVLNNDGV